MKMLVFDLSRPDNIYDAVMGEDVGTVVYEESGNLIKNILNLKGMNRYERDYQCS